MNHTTLHYTFQDEGLLFGLQDYCYLRDRKRSWGSTAEYRAELAMRLRNCKLYEFHVLCPGLSWTRMDFGDIPVTYHKVEIRDGVYYLPGGDRLLIE